LIALVAAALAANAVIVVSAVMEVRAFVTVVLLAVFAV
jgi:hypothetical protein